MTHEKCKSCEHCECCNCHPVEGENPEQREARLKLQRLMTRRSDLESIRQYTDRARARFGIQTPEFDLLIAVEQLWGIEKRRLSRELKVAGLAPVKR